MFFAEKSNNVTLKTYLDLVTHHLEKRDDTYKELIDKIIFSTADVSRNSGQNLDKIDPSIYYIVSKLYATNGSYFASIHSSLDITMEVYTTLKSFLSTLVSIEEKN